MTRFRRFNFMLLATVMAAATLVASCASRPQIEFTGMLAPLKNCRARYAEMDARIDAAGVRDASYYRIPGFPYLRTDRTLASFVNEVHSVDEVGGWTRRMREYDQEAREFEYVNLGLSKKELAALRYDMLSCGRGLASYELDDPAVFASLQKAVQPPDDYSSSARLFKGYLLAQPGLKSRVSEHQAQILKEFARPLTELQSPGPLVRWQVKPVEDQTLVTDGFVTAVPDELGFPALTDSHWRAFAEVNAPQFWIETASERDQIGTPVWLGSGAGVDVSRPVVNYQITFTRFGEERLAQIVYFIWFKGSKSSGEASQVAADIDGLIWRVTLDARGRPLVYESLHASGRDHLMFPAQALEPREGGRWPERPLIPQTQVPASDAVVRLQSDTHAVRRVLSAKQIQSDSTQQYELRRYEHLFTLERPGGGTRSLYDTEGLIPGTEPRSSSWALNASGILKPGALRQLGHHATAYVGRREFDDPYILNSVFRRIPSAIGQVQAPPPG